MSTTDQRSIAEGLAECIDGASPDARSIPTGLEAITSALLAIHDLLDARLPATTPQDPVGAPVAGAEAEDGSVGGGDAREAVRTDIDKVAAWYGVAALAPLPVAQDDEVIVKRDLIERVVEVLDGEGYRVRASQLRAALDRGQGA